MDPSATCDLLVAEQHGVLSRDQALAAGLTRRSIDRRLASGQWRVVHPGVYAARPVPRSWKQDVLAAILCGGSSAIASHRSAGALWKLAEISEGLVEISVSSGRSIRGTVVHRRQRDDVPAIAVIDGIPTTGIERTLLDLAAVMSSREVGLALDDALRRQLTTLGAVREMLSAPKGRAGTRLLRQLVLARDDRVALAESRLESAFLNLLRTHAVPLPVPQYRVMEGTAFVARLDFAYPSRQLAIETDGYRWHGGVDSWRRDLRRENRLKLLGWTVLRFSWADVHDRPEVVVSQIRAALRIRPPGFLS